jgi:hypothetical protein
LKYTLLTILINLKYTWLTILINLEYTLLAILINLKYIYAQTGIKFVSDLRQVDGFLQVLQFPPPIFLTATI